MVTEGTLKILNSAGMHARASTRFVQTANRFRCNVSVEKDGQVVNGKSIMGVLLLVAAQGSEIKVRCEGEDSELCFQALKELVQDRFGEE
ncbi:MAG: HPr family phosphocarrier protein [Myxococcales bacterium]|nr:HPr family phosphocarrier protein [Myxococcota bacterium]MDW8284046.1 HPr family phosphocarrier protein [Myxococcales bacterium]